MSSANGGETCECFMSLDGKVLEAIRNQPGIKAREIAQLLDVDKKRVNSLLYGKLKGKVRQDNGYQWYPICAGSTGDTGGKDAVECPDTPLSKLCRYYLACLGQDENGVSVFADNKFGDADYCEINQLPIESQAAVFAEDGAQQLLGRLRKDRSRLGMYLGYPTALRQHTSKKGWTGFFVEPVFLFPVELEGDGTGTPKLDISYPMINQSVLKRFSNADKENLMEELVQLEDELGINGDADPIELDELAQRLASIRTEWPWKEEIDPDNLSTGLSLAEINEAGVFNRAVLVVAERSPFTQGLESELKSLAHLQPEQYANTALGQWISGDIPQPSTGESPSLVEVLPLNTEQRQAINHSLVNPLSVITGPPGTGKSQVVTDMLINCAWHNKRVLFASKNNKAVDVVETRVNNLGSRPLLLRIGSRAYQTRLAEYLISLLSATITEEDKQEYEAVRQQRLLLDEKLNKLSAEIDRVIELRNAVDQLEQAAEEAREKLPPGVKRHLKELEISDATQAIEEFKKKLERARLDKQPIFTRLVWWLLKKKRYQALRDMACRMSTVFEKLAVDLPKTAPSDEAISEWLAVKDEIIPRIKHAIVFKEYLSALAELQNSRALEAIYSDQSDLIHQLSTNAEALWSCWLRLQPAKLSKEDRAMLASYKAILRMVIETGPDAKLGSKIYKEYVSLFPKVSHLLPCWAVTSLSARGKLPFQADFFDIVVFDEASQCDIASALPLLYRAKQAVIIGDPKQLSHISALQKGQDQMFLEKFDLLQYANWAYSYNSLFDLASSLSAGDDIISLRDHHRSHADIIGFSNSMFYEGKLRVATRYEHLNRNPKEPGVRWINVNGAVRRPTSGGAENEAEAKAVVMVLKKLIIDRGYRGSVGVVSPFRAQANLIRRLVEMDDVLGPEVIKHDFLADTVHKFQGDERDVMVFSPVVSNGITPGALSFLRNNGNLFNVAITRARAMLLVVGDQQAASQCSVDYLAKFAVYASELQTAEEKQIEHDIEDLGPEYPVVSHPERVSDWERDLYKALYANGIKTLPQYQVEMYALDLALFDGERRLDIEVDGERYHRNWTGELCRRDQIRNQRMFELGWDVMRFWVYEVRDDMEGCIQRVRSWLEERE